MYMYVYSFLQSFMQELNSIIFPVSKGSISWELFFNIACFYFIIIYIFFNQNSFIKNPLWSFKVVDRFPDLPSPFLMQDGDSEGDSGFVTPDSTTKERESRFVEGQDVLSHGKDGLYYLGTIVVVRSYKPLSFIFLIPFSSFFFLLQLSLASLGGFFFASLRISKWKRFPFPITTTTISLYIFHGILSQMLWVLPFCSCLNLGFFNNINVHLFIEW